MSPFPLIFATMMAVATLSLELFLRNSGLADHVRTVTQADLWSASAIVIWTIYLAVWRLEKRR